MKCRLKHLLPFCFAAFASLSGHAAAPTVLLLSPTNGPSYFAGLSLTFVASASDSDGTVTKVAFYAGVTKIGEATTIPYKATWTNVPAGVYSVTAVATDNTSLSTTSAVLTVTINALGANQVNLVPAESVWKYLDNGTDQGTAWRATIFNDSTWSSGQAQLGYGDGDEVTRVEDNGTPGYNNADTDRYVTTYFRSAFTLTNASSYTNLTVRLLRDDGGVVYLNGTGVFTNNMPTGVPILFNTLAAGNAGTADENVTFYPNTVPPSLLVNGTNVVAVEIHQVLQNSSDISFDLELIGDLGTPNTPPSVTVTNPANGSSFAAPAGFSVGASASDTDGTVVTVDFYQNGAPIGSDSTNPYSVPVSNLNPGSYAYRAVATDNRGSATTSAIVNVTVTGVVNQPPTVSITSPANNSTYNAPTNLPVTVNASDPGGSVSKVEFFRGGTKLGESSSSPFNFTWTNALVGTFQLTAIATDNLSATGTSAPVSITFTSTAPALIFPTGSVWKYLDTGVDLGTAWTAPGFNDSAWPAGPGQLGYDTDHTENDESTVLGYGPDIGNKYITYYFRRSFVVGSPGAYSFLQAIYLRDDGIVGYLNGTEVFTNNMPSGAINFQTLAANATDDGKALFTNIINPTLLVPGTNVFAVEIHQATPGSTDISFEMELHGNTGAIVNNPPAVALSSPANNSSYTAPATIALTATASDSDGMVSLVEFYSNGSKIGQSAGPSYTYTWSGVPVGSYALLAIATDNFGATATSAVANVFVSASSAPTILSHSPTNTSVSNLTSITVQFSQPVDNVNAADFLVNLAPATSMTTSNNLFYTFTFPQPMDGVVGISFAANHSIVNREVPPKPFDETGTNATWQYTLADTVRPTLVAITPAPGATMQSLTELSVTFSEAVGGIDASDLQINGTNATSISGYGAGPYKFQFDQPTNGTVTLGWASNHGIHDLAAAQNPFVANSWTYTLRTNLIETNVVISEIMYHPSSERATEEYIELLNKGTNAVSFVGWRMHGGIEFNFPTYTLQPGKFLVIAANLAAFNTKYPSVTNVLGGWLGQLSNTDDDLNLDDASGQRVDSVHYADEGDWSMRVRDPLFSTTGWAWSDDTDGGGKSLELINTNMPNRYGQNWAASTTVNGTPGGTNSVSRANIAPLLLDVAHAPIVPKSTDAVTITARLLDEQTTGLSAKLAWRDATLSPPSAWTTNTMFDDGLHGDGAAGDQVFGAILSPMPNHTVVEFFVIASDAQSLTRTWPAAARQSDNVTFAQTANALYQVDDTVYAGGMPYFRLIMTEGERALLDDLAHNNPGSNAEMNGAFVSSDGVATELRYRCAIRIRGAGSRGRIPPNFRLRFPSDQRWHGLTSRNLNTQWPYSQVAGSIFTRKAGMHSEEAIAAQVRVNSTNLAYTLPDPGGYPFSYQYGAYNFLESRDSGWAANHFPDDPNGNLYTCTRPDASLLYRGTDPGSYSSYQKDTNKGENDYTDIIHLTDVLNNTPDAQYAAAVRQVVNVEEWVRYFAVLAMVGYDETSIGSNGDPDDYSMYRGINDTRFYILPHDHDTDFGEGDTGNPPTQWGIFRATASSVVNRFLKCPDFVPLYYAELKRLADSTFTAAEANKLFDDSLGNWIPAAVVTRMKDWTAQRRAYVLTQIPLNLTLTPPALGTQNGYYYTTVSSVSLSGLANAIDTRSVKVNGQIATWTAWQAAWSISGFAVQPGINRITVESFDANSHVLETITLDIWYDDSSVASVSGAISGSTTWTAVGGPYQVTANVTVGSGATLTIQPGTTVYLNSGVNITVSGTGRLLAEGTAGQHIRFTRAPGTAVTWGQIFLNGATLESRIAYAEVEYAGSAGGAIRADNSILYMDHVVFANTAVQYANLNGSSFNIRNSVFPSTSGIELIHGDGLPISGYGIIDGNWFGTTTGLNDIIDFTGGQRPNAILQILNNVFSGASDDVLDLDGTDAHIEGNIFANVHQQTPGGDTSSAISGGSDTTFGFQTSELTIVRNLFYDCDHIALAKEGNFYTLINNTAIHIPVAAINFSEPARNTAGGAGALLDGNIIYDCPLLLQNYTSAVMTVTCTRSIIPTNFPGIGNTNLDPMLTRISGVTWQTLPNDFRLLSGSPALGTGPNGLDMGGLVPPGASISGEPASPTALTTATLTVGGPGIVAYRFKINGGAYTAETPVTTAIVLSGMANGLYQVFVIGKNSAGVYQPMTNATASRPWVVNTMKSVVRLNEILAQNDAAVAVGGNFPDLIELYNPSSNPVSLAGYGITDEADNPFKFTFPSNATISAGQYLVLYADNDSAPPGYHLGFSLKSSGDEVFLTTSNGMIADSITFGMQLPDRSIGRMADGSWRLCTPTFGAANLAARTGDTRTLKINEWLAHGVTPYPDDFIELFNPDPLPVALGDLFLTDNPIGAPFQYDIAPLSFIAGAGFVVFTADGNAEAGPDHVNFKLSSDQGIIGLLAADGSVIDCVIYGPQTADISMGRQPNGSSTYGFFSPATPGAPNPGIIIPGQTLVINEVLALNTQKKEADGSTPDWVEFFNPSTNLVDMSDMSFSDDSATPRKYVFAAGTKIAARGLRTIKCDPDLAPATNNTGFGLKSTGQTLYLFDKMTNGGGELNAVSFGVQAADFSIGRVLNGSTNWVLGLESIGVGNNAVVLGDPATLKVNEWMANPSSGDDWFEIYNPNPQPVALAGLWLTDDISSPATRMKHKIAPLSFIGINGWAYQRFEADSNLAGGPEHVNFGLKAGGEALGISSPAGALIDGTNFGAQALGVSQGRLPDGTANIVSFPGTASPGDPNYLLLTNIVINEVLSHTDAPFEDAIELRNLTGTDINIGNWYLSDAKHALKKHHIAPGTTLGANGFKVFYEYQFNETNTGFGFSLNSAKGDDVYLAQTTVGDALTGYRAQVSFGAAENAVSFGRYVTTVGESHFVAMSARTFGTDNPDIVEEFRTGAGLPNAYPKVGPIVISEIMYHPPDLGGVDNPLDEFIELRNITGVTQAMYHPLFRANTWKLKNAVSFTFPTNITIPPNGFLIVVGFDPTNTAQLSGFQTKYNMSPATPIVGPWNGKLDNADESIELYKPDPPQTPPDPDAGYVPYILVDKVHYFDSAPWPSCGPNCGADGAGMSLQRVSPDEYGNDPINWTVAAPTPGPQNSIVDTDGDNMDDNWEMTYFQTLARNGAGDFDGDGFTDLQEYLAGTDPTNPSSNLRLQIIHVGPAMVRFTPLANRSYTIEYSDSLFPASWQRLLDINATPTPTTITATDSTPRTSRFYRLRTPKL